MVPCDVQLTAQVLEGDNHTFCGHYGFMPLLTSLPEVGDVGRALADST